MEQTSSMTSLNTHKLPRSSVDSKQDSKSSGKPFFQDIVEANCQTENAIKHRINTSDKANNEKDQTVASIYDNRFCFDFYKFTFSVLPYCTYFAK